MKVIAYEIVTSVKIVALQVITGFKAIVLTPFIFFFEKFIFSDWDFGISILILLLIDAFVAISVSLLKKEITVLKMIFEWLLRSLVLLCGVITVSVIDKALIEGKENGMIDWVHSGFLIVFLFAIGAGILNNLYLVYPAEWIKEVLKRIGFKKDNNSDLNGMVG
jgi:hypothetical protein